MDARCQLACRKKPAVILSKVDDRPKPKIRHPAIQKTDVTVREGNVQ